MTRTDILTVAVVAATLSGVTWWLQQQPVEGPAATTEGNLYVGHGGTCPPNETCATPPEAVGTDITTSMTGIVNGTDLTFGANSVQIAPPAQPVGTILVFDPERLELIIGTSGTPIAWIEPIGGPNGKPRVRIRNGRVADTVRALVLLAITQPAGAANDPMVAEWIRRLEK